MVPLAVRGKTPSSRRRFRCADSLQPDERARGILVTGTEVLTGRVADRNGPWVADRLLELGVELAHLTICGDRFADIEAQLRFLRSGCGPDRDDRRPRSDRRRYDRRRGRQLLWSRTRAGRGDGGQDRRIVARWMALSRTSTPRRSRAANRKQAMVPVGAEVLDPVGTAPGVVVPGEPTVVVLPGRPRNCRGCGRRRCPPTRAAALAGRTVYQQETVLMFGVAESGLAETLREAERLVTGFEELEITTCLRRGELEVVTRYEPGGEPTYRSLLELLRQRHGAIFRGRLGNR